MRLYLWYNLGTTAVSDEAVSRAVLWLIPPGGWKLAAQSCGAFNENNTLYLN